MLIESIIIVLFSIWLWYKFYFLRNPNQNIGKGIVSPADGRIQKIITISSDELIIKKRHIGKIITLTKDIQKPSYLISIFMNIFDVHYNRIPLDGTVVSVKHKKGKFNNAGNFMKSLYNEKTEILIKSKYGNYKIIQVAGFIARRCVSFVKAGDKVKKGQVFGLIKFGSQVNLILPAKNQIKIKLKLNQRVKAGETIAE